MNDIVKGALDIYGFCCPVDISAHKNVIEYLKNTGRFKKSLEIGYCSGRTSFAPLQFEPEKHYIVDAYFNEEDGKKDKERPNVEVFKMMSQQLPSSKIDEMLRRIDFMLIDGDHTFNGVKTDLELAGKVLSPHGIVVLDDTYTFYALHIEAINQFLNENKDFHILFKTKGQTYLCRADVHEEYYNFFLQNLPRQILEDLDFGTNLKVLSGTVYYNYSSFATAPYFTIDEIGECEIDEATKHLEYFGEAPYKEKGGTFPIIERKDLHYLDIE